MGLGLAMPDGNAGVATDLPLLLFLAGPLLFLGLLAWRRRDHPGRSRTILWSTVGVSENIVDASFEALTDSIIYKLYRDKAPV